MLVVTSNTEWETNNSIGVALSTLTITRTIICSIICTETLDKYL